MYKITLSDGSTIENLELNGTEYISQEELTVDMFYGKLSPLVIYDENDNVQRSFEDAYIIHIWEMDDGWWIAFDEKTLWQKLEESLTELEIIQMEDEQVLTDHDIAILELQNKEDWEVGYES